MSDYDNNMKGVLFVNEKTKEIDFINIWIKDCLIIS